MVLKPQDLMDTRGKCNTEFRNEVSEILARHEANFGQIYNTLQSILAKLQTLQTNPEITDVNPFDLVTLLTTANCRHRRHPLPSPLSILNYPF